VFVKKKAHHLKRTRLGRSFTTQYPSWFRFLLVKANNLKACVYNNTSLIRFFIWQYVQVHRLYWCYCS